MADKTPEEIAAEKKAADEKAAAEAKAARAASVKVRVLTDHQEHLVNEVVTLSADAAEAAEKAGWADSSPAAVAYAEKEARKRAKADAED